MACGFGFIFLCLIGFFAAAWSSCNAFARVSVSQHGTEHAMYQTKRNASGKKSYDNT